MRADVQAYARESWARRGGGTQTSSASKQALYLRWPCQFVSAAMPRSDTSALEQQKVSSRAEYAETFSSVRHENSLHPIE